ncbi:hypothetical protein FH508_0004020 [Lysinibacillus sp. CD3-6]|uniref:hypothetical protein n=1 Tax=Lysinibacillus sp. CD3-6 TaxID=2892541 RepID=UPI00116C0D8A|nr:hypothetical protein [Lysinibacillus sp. CD3-6]UED81066.1 hypothetical protein FH508_0004020 [Lysinibacillus sp. CD3-6]
MKPRFVKITKKTHDLNWWYRYGLIGKTFEVLAISPYSFAKIEYEEDTFGWLPLDVCEINPHLKVVSC